MRRSGPKPGMEVIMTKLVYKLTDYHSVIAYKVMTEDEKEARNWNFRFLGIAKKWIAA